MINLLSKSAKNEITAARRNVILRKYMVTLIVLAALVSASYAVGYIMLSEQQMNYTTQVARYEPQKSQYANVIKQAGDFNKNLSVAKSILSNEITFSTLVTDIAQILPPRVVLGTLSLSTANLSQPLTLTFTATSPQDAIALKTSFERSAYFTDTKILTIDHSNYEQYPYAISLMTTIDKVKYTAAQKAGRP